jgi:hypothetical protein
MTNQVQPTSPGTSGTSNSDKATKKNTVRQTPHIDSQEALNAEVLSINDSFRNFINDIELARTTGEEFVEVGPEIIKHFNPQGLKGASYFIYRGIKVCQKDMTDKVSKELSIPHYAKSGLNYAKVEGTHE